MPETSVHEDSDFAFCEDDVGSDEPPVDADREILAESVAKAMELRPQGDLWLGINTTYGRHVA